jgi:hypothetical protein
VKGSSKLCLLGRSPTEKAISETSAGHFLDTPDKRPPETPPPPDSDAIASISVRPIGSPIRVPVSRVLPEAAHEPPMSGEISCLPNP